MVLDEMHSLNCLHCSGFGLKTSFLSLRSARLSVECVRIKVLILTIGLFVAGMTIGAAMTRIDSYR